MTLDPTDDVPAPSAPPGRAEDPADGRDSAPATGPTAQPEAADAVDPVASRTGDETVDAVLDRLASVDDGTPLPERVQVLVEAHEALQRRLTAADG
ncbi:hypothetical protein [Thalassiella azotivora]